MRSGVSAAKIAGFAIAVAAAGGAVGAIGARDASAAGGESGRPFAGHAWLGVAMDKAAGAEGVRVKHVVRGSPAERAGVKEGDAIRAIDGTQVASPEEVTRIVGDHEPGDAVVATIARGGAPITVRIALAPRPSMDEMVRMDRVGAFAPAWVGVEPLGDAPRSMNALRGKVVLLDFWATWCGPCRVLAPKLTAMQSRYGAQGLRVVGVTTEGGEEVATFAERIGMRYALATDPHADTTRAYGVSALPTLFVIDKRGVVRDVAVGYAPERDAQIEALVKQLLAEPAPSE